MSIIVNVLILWPAVQNQLTLLLLLQTTAGEWLRYTVVVEQAGLYTSSLRLMTDNGEH